MGYGKRIIKVVPLQMTEFWETLTLASSPILQMGKLAERGREGLSKASVMIEAGWDYNPVSGSCHLPGTRHPAKPSLLWASPRTRNWSSEAKQVNTC